MLQLIYLDQTKNKTTQQLIHFIFSNSYFFQHKRHKNIESQSKLQFLSYFLLVLSVIFHSYSLLHVSNTQVHTHTFERDSFMWLYFIYYDTLLILIMGNPSYYCDACVQLVLRLSTHGQWVKGLGETARRIGKSKNGGPY